MANIALFLFLGLVAGVLSGMIGIGGGIIIVPALVFIFGFAQHEAQGTTLALMVPPISLLAAWTYYQHGHVDLKIAGIICLGFFVGGLIGADFATGIPSGVLQKIFGIALLVTGFKMILG